MTLEEFQDLIHIIEAAITNSNSTHIEDYARYMELKTDFIEKHVETN